MAYLCDNDTFINENGEFVIVHIDQAGYEFNPREEDCVNIGTFITWVGGYRSPDETRYHDEDSCLDDIMYNLGLLSQYEDEAEEREKELEPYWESYYNWHHLKCVGERQIRLFEYHKITAATRRFYRWYLQKQPTTKAKPIDTKLAWLLTQAATRDDIVLLPVNHYSYDSTYSTDTPRECVDANYDGVIYTTDERIKELYGIDEVTDEHRKRALEELRHEVEYYSMWASGNVWWYETFDKGGNMIDSCSGFIGDDSSIIEDATGKLEETSMTLDEWVESIA